MKKTLVSLIVVLLLSSLFLVSCGGYQSSYDDAEKMQESFRANKDLFLKVAIEAFALGEETYISTYEYFRPEGTSADAVGLYVHNTRTGVTQDLQSEDILFFFETCGVHSLAVNVKDEIRTCEFSIGGGRQYYNGIYYAEPDRPLFLSNYSIPLEADGNGFSYSVENMNYYTEKWDDNFYYYVAKTRQGS